MYDVNLISLPWSKRLAILSTSALSSCFHAFWGLETPNSCPAPEQGGWEVGTRVYHLLLCPLGVSPQTSQPRDESLCSNMTFPLVNHTRKMADTHLPSGVTYTEGPLEELGTSQNCRHFCTPFGKQALFHTTLQVRASAPGRIERMRQRRDSGLLVVSREPS